VSFVWPGGDVESLPPLGKDEVADRLLDRVAKMLGAREWTLRGSRLAAMAGLLLCAPPLAAGAAHVNLVKIDGSINPASSDYLQNAIAQSEADGAQALLLELDTPGGLLVATKDIRAGDAQRARAGDRVRVAARRVGGVGGSVRDDGRPHRGDGARHEHRRRLADQRERRGRLARRRRQARGRRPRRRRRSSRPQFVEAIAKQRKRNAEWAAKAVREAEAVTEDEALKLG